MGTVTDRAGLLTVLEQEVRACPLCDLQKSRTRAVPGEGPVDAEIMFIGEAPGFNEDKQGRPFIGQAGQLLDELLASIDLDRASVYITNVVKCRPPGNRDPLPYEIEACAPYLARQLELIKPKVVVTLGRHSMAKFFPGASISRIHGQPRRVGSTYYFPMFHPAAALHRRDLLPVLKEDMLKLPALIAEMRAAQEEERDASGAAGATVAEPGPARQLGLFDQ